MKIRGGEALSILLVAIYLTTIAATEECLIAAKLNYLTNQGSPIEVREYWRDLKKREGT